MSNSNRKPLVPQEFRPAEDDLAGRVSSSARVEKVLWLGVAALVTLGLGWYITAAWSPGEPAQALQAVPQQSSPAEPQAQPAAPLPFEAAAEQQARQQAQQLLSQLLDESGWLEQARASRWAPDALSGLQQEGMRGDQHYEQREYQQAIEVWSNALAQARELREQAAVEAARFARAAADALARGDLQQAQDQIEVAMAIDPDSVPWQQLAARIQQRPELLRIMDESAAHMQRREFDLAVQQLQQVVDRDPEYATAASLLEQARQAQQQQNFASEIAEALFAIEQKRFAAAENHLNAAAAWQADAPALADARLQLESARHDASVIRAHQQARSAEAEENWPQAMASWQELERLSPGSTDARIGLIRSGARAELDHRLQQTLADPLRLREEAPWQAAEALLREAMAVRQPGPRLQRQVEQLTSAIQTARTPVILAVQSDNLTDLRINGVGPIGTTRQTELELYPGRYTLVGTRAGYREVLMQLELRGDQPRLEVYLSANQPVDAP